MGCATTTVKICFIVFNIILAFLVIGTTIWIGYNDDSTREDVAIATYVTCGLILLFSFTGCFAAIRESVCLTATCAIFLLLLAITQITFTCINMVDRKVHNGLEKVELAWENNEMDFIQEEHECCGKVSAHDYVLLGKDIPASCYVDKKVTNLGGLYLQGCSAKMQEYYDSEIYRYSIISWVLVAFEFLGFLLAVFLLVNFRNKKRRMQF